MKTLTERLNSADARMTSAVALEVAVCEAVLEWLPAGRAAVSAKEQHRQAEAQAQAADSAFIASCADVVGTLDPELGADLRAIGPARVLAEVKGDSPLLRQVRSVAADAVKAHDARQKAQATRSATQGASATLWRDVLIAHDALLAPSPNAYAALRRLFESALTNPDQVAEGVRERLKALGA